MYRKCLVALGVALIKADYGIRKLYKVKKQKVNIYSWDEIMKSKVFKIYSRIAHRFQPQFKNRQK